jgi:transcriptional regulator with XRE-family HTH domain
MSQTFLADGLGLTFQQVQKYEKGTNRVGAGRLQQIAGLLDVPVQFFFEGNGAGAGAGKDADTGPSVFALMQSKGSVKIVAALHKIRNANVKRVLTELVEAIAERDI